MILNHFGVLFPNVKSFSYNVKHYQRQKGAVRFRCRPERDYTMSEPSRDWSIERAVEDMTAIGAFGPGRGFVSFTLDNRHTGQDQFASVVLYGTVTLRDEPDGLRSHQLVIKLKHRTPEMIALCTNDAQFHNEKLFYERIKPFLLDCAQGQDRLPSLCRYFYGRNECGDQAFRDAIVLENECPRGYRCMSGDRKFMDFDHLVVALRTLAKFHGLSYRAKHKASDEFADMVADVKDTHWKDDGSYALPFQVIESLISVCLDRMEERHGGDGRTSRFRAKLSGCGAERLLRTVLVPREPLAVLCHGDFNVNNLLFRYDDHGTPVDALVMDVADVRYVSPAFDLSFFLYMNTDRGTREAHWDALLDEYCAALSECVADVVDVVRVPDRGQVDAEMRRLAFYALVRVSFFMRVMCIERTAFDDVMSFVHKDVEEITRVMLSFGGDRATDLIADVVQHIFDIGAAETVDEL
ncbi:uncharacterized protein LOC112681639 [Sipha flava]|uniref:Uncharacterized protein LOC112681639 n=2 Tax=Sipha flava TaxID=143950 RepID=A0A8B8FA02_9HEMI|nr:uncharacterized protein LOC112681639 [Sipha flava]